MCSRKSNCPVHRKLRDLQEQMDDFLQGVTLEELKREQATSEKVKTGSE
jgi:DNA-binding IscR family transcriptional regulator